MAFDNNDVKSINSPLIILSLSRAGTASSDTGRVCVVVSCGPLAAVKKFSVVLVCRLLVVPIDGEGGLLLVVAKVVKEGCQRPRINALLSHIWRGDLRLVMVG